MGPRKRSKPNPKEDDDNLVASEDQKEATVVLDSNPAAAGEPKPELAERRRSSQSVKYGSVSMHFSNSSAASTKGLIIAHWNKKLARRAMAERQQVAASHAGGKRKYHKCWERSLQCYRICSGYRCTIAFAVPCRVSCASSCEFKPISTSASDFRSIAQCCASKQIAA